MRQDDDTLYLVIDYETRSHANLKKCGAYEYAKDETTEVICCAWKFGTRANLKDAPTRLWTRNIPERGTEDWNGFLNALLLPQIVVVAHNAFFEQMITKHVVADRLLQNHRLLASRIKPDRFICTASLAAALALPRNLEGAGAAIKLPVQKDMAGHRLMLKHSKPRRPTKKNPEGGWHDDQDEIEKIYAYCKTDVQAETLLFLKLPPLNKTERRIWQLDQKINARGFAVDRPLVTKIRGMIAEETAWLDARCAKLTGGKVSSARQREALRAYLEPLGCALPDMKAGTVADAIKTGLAEGQALELLQVRRDATRSSTAKYEAFDIRSRNDGRLRDILRYHAANTGRWGGTGVQPQNLPKASFKDTIQASEILAECDLETIRLLYGSPMDVFSGCLRNMIVAPPGKVLDVADYSAIEARMLFWLAGHEDGLRAYRDGRDLYRELAARVYACKLETVAAEQRWLGKQAILGCGYGMGFEKFRSTCASYGVTVSEELARTAVSAYRDTHPLVPKLWGNLERAARAAIENPGTAYTINQTRWWVKKGFLWCRLPSGRRLAYAQPVIKWELPRWGGNDKRPVIYHHGEDPKTKKWMQAKTWGGTLTENVVQAISRDVMAEAMLRIEGAGWQLVLTVHDELIAERALDMPTLTPERFCALMSQLPKWAPNAAIAVEGWTGVRYKK